MWHRRLHFVLTLAGLALVLALPASAGAVRA